MRTTIGRCSDWTRKAAEFSPRNCSRFRCRHETSLPWTPARVRDGAGDLAEGQVSAESARKSYRMPSEAARGGRSLQRTYLQPTPGISWAMFTLRCTQKLLRRGLTIAPTPDEPSSTVLGDWYANVLHVGQRQVVLCASAKTLLPVVLTAKEARNTPHKLRLALAPLLHALEIAGPSVDQELALMGEYRVGRTADRRVISSLNELVFLLKHQIYHHGNFTLQEHALRLAETPMKLIEFASPDRATRSAFLAAHAERIP